MKLVVLTGIPGSGSTTLLNKALEEVDYVHLNYGDIMTEIAIEEKIVDDRDALRKLSPDVQKEIQEKGEHKMENTKSHIPVALRKQIGGTMYVVRVHFNEDAKEIMKDKIKRLIENDVRGTQHTA